MTKELGKDKKEEKPEDKKMDANFLEEDDEFEEFPMEEWQGKEGEEEDDVNVWEDNWDDESVEDDFSNQLKACLESQNKSKTR